MPARRLALGSVLQVTNLVAAAFASLLLMPYVVSTVGDAAYGVWIVVGAFVGYYGLLDFGLSAAVTRFLGKAVGAQDRQNLQDTYSTAVTIYTALGGLALVITALLVIVVPPASATSAPVFRRVLGIAGLAFALGFPLRAFSGLAQAFLRYDIPALLELTAIIVRSALVVALLRRGWSIDGLAVASLVAVLIQLLLWRPIMSRLDTDVSFAVRQYKRAIARRLVNFSAFVFVRQLADLVRFRLDVLIVGHFVGIVAVTHYGIATVLIGYFMGFVTSVMGVLTGVFSRYAGANDSNALQQSFILGTRISVFVTTFAGFGLLAWGRAFITRWMGPTYTDSYPILAVLTVGCTFALWQAPSISAMYAVNKHRFLATATIAEAAVNLVLSVLLAQRYGMVGVAYGTTIPMMLVKLSLQPVYVCRVLEMPLKTYVIAAGAAALKATIALTPGIMLSYSILKPSYLSLIIVSGATALSYGTSLWLWGFDGRERKLLRSIVSPRPATA